MDIVSLIRGIIGIVFLLALAYSFSSNRRSVNWRLVGVGVGLQFFFALFVLKITVGRLVFDTISRWFVRLFGFAGDGAQFVFGSLAAPAGTSGSIGFFFAFQVLPTIIFFASFMAVLYHLGIAQRFVQAMAWVIAKFMRASGSESLCIAANTFMGQTEAPLVIRPYLASLTQSELLTIMTSGMAHISGGVMIAYYTMLGAAVAKVQGGAIDASQVYFAAHLLAACIMAGPATLVVAKILYPESGEPLTMGTVKLKVEKAHSNVIEAAAAGASDGVKLALNVGGMLIAFIALIALINFLLGELGSVTGWNAAIQAKFGMPLSLELVSGLIFQFIAFAIGVPWSEALNVGSLMGIKMVLNEFVAYSKMADALSAHQLSQRAMVIATYSLCGFANFSSIAIQIGGIGPLAENRRGDIARFGLRALLGGTIATWMTASIAGMFVG
ncbi:MAG TPA: nucleoside transporter C-terminal domain-containing protein [Bacteroidota bacterium]|nr:nucleoside transporter C-terminal domain-containing protein [Bacteroidota bacterium]